MTPPERREGETPQDDEADYDPDYSVDENDDDSEFDCHGHFYPMGKGGRFTCGAAGSEDCDFECPYNKWLGLTNAEINKL